MTDGITKLKGSTKMDDLTVCRLSAEALGKTGKALLGKFALHGSGIVWNPLTNAEQRWECVEWLLKQKYDVHLGPHNYHYSSWGEDEGVSYSETGRCPASEFPARAVAELQLRKEKANG